MEEKIMSPLEVKVTFIHDPTSKELKKTMDWLDERVASGNLHNIPAIIAVYDRQTRDHFVYDGNKRTAHARDNNYHITARVMKTQQDLTNFIKNETACWFSIDNFNKLLTYMRAYSKTPRYDEITPEIKSMVTSQRKNNQQQLFFDDEEY